MSKVYLRTCFVLVWVLAFFPCDAFLPMPLVPPEIGHPFDVLPQQQAVAQSPSRSSSVFQRTKTLTISSALFAQENPASDAPAKLEGGNVVRGEHNSSVSVDTTNFQESVTLSQEDDDDDDDDEEYEYVQYEKLTEQEFVDSKWKIRMVRFGHLDDTEEALVRLFRFNGKNLVEWGDGGKGDWWFDRTTQQLLISKQDWWWGRTTWTCVIDDYYYLEGLYRRWTFITPLSIIGQWQGIREDDEGEIFPNFNARKNSNNSTARNSS